MTNPAITRGRRFTPFRIAVFLIIVLGLFIWQGSEKIPVGFASGTSLNGSATTHPSSDILRVATFNIDGKDGDDTADTMKNFDLIGIEEVHGSFPFSSSNQADILGGKLGLQYLFAPVERQWWHDSFGDGVLTSLSLEHWQRIPIAAENADSNRQVLFLRLKWNDKPVNVLITHLERHADREAELASVISLFLSLESPAILMGDFNTDADDPQFQLLRKTPGVIDPIGDIIAAKSGGSYDRIFARGLKSTNAGFIDKGASDHPLAWVDLQLDAAAK